MLGRRCEAIERPDDHGPFDIIGDVHGCADELVELLRSLGYIARLGDEGFYHPAHRKAVFVGDLIDRGPRTVMVLDIVRRMVSSGNALAVPGNHDDKLLRWLSGVRVNTNNGLDTTVKQIEAITNDRVIWLENVKNFLESLPSHLILDDGHLLIAHAGLIEKLQGRTSKVARHFCLFGGTTRGTDPMGRPLRWDWAPEYLGARAVIYGHTPHVEAHWVNNTINIDTGCVYGGSLTALTWPDRTIISVHSHRTYAELSRPFLP
jgi:protein phosphatase